MIKSDNRSIISIPDFIFISILFFIFANSVFLINSNMLVHIKSGQWIINNRLIPVSDIFAVPGNVWINETWLYDIFLANIYNFLGFGGVAVTFGAIIAAIFAIVFSYLLYKKANILISLAFLLATIWLSKSQWMVDSIIISTFFFTCYFIIMDEFAFGVRKNVMFFLIPIQWIWYNINRDSLIGFVFLVFFSIYYWWTFRGGAEKKKYHMILLLVVVLCILLFFNTPYDIEVVLKHGSENIWHIVSRNGVLLSPDFHMYGSLLKYFSLNILFIILLIKNMPEKDRMYFLMLIIIMSQGLFLFAQKYIMIYLVLSAMIMPQIVGNIRRTWIKNVEYSEKKELFGVLREACDERKKINFLIVLFVMASVIFIAKGKESDYESVLKSWNRYKGVEYVLKNHLNNNGFHSDFRGDMLIWFGEKGRKVFIDSTRIYLYNLEYTNDYSNIINAKRNWGKILNKYGVDWILIEDQTMLAKMLINEEGWIKVYSNQGVSVFLTKKYYDYKKELQK